MQPLLLVLLALMVAFWALFIPFLYSCNDRDGWVSKVMDHPVAVPAFFIGVVAIGFGIGAIGLYSNVTLEVVGYGGQLWERGNRLSCLTLTSVFFTSFVTASFTAIGISGFFVVEAVKDIVSACTGKPRVQVVG